jgi:uncharacterized membrane protein YhaH (DUF805 family)
MKLLNYIHYIRSSFTNWVDLKSKATRLEFFIGLLTSALFLALNVFILIQLNSYFAYFRSDTLTIITLIYFFIVVLFTFIQCHSLVARRLNDISVNPYFAFLPLLLASSYLLLKSFYDTDAYGHFTFLVILLMIVIYSTMILSESD